MNFLARFIHELKGRHYAKLASQLRRDLAEHILAEESRIAICRHRASWHFTQSAPPASLAACGTLNPTFQLDGNSPPSRPPKRVPPISGTFEEKP